MANASQHGNAAESPNHRGSIKGPFRVDGHLQMPFRGCFLARASPNPTSGLSFPFRITSMSFTGWHGVFVSFVILNDVTQPPQTHTPDHKVYFGLKVVYFCSIPESFTPSICPVLFCGSLCQDLPSKSNSWRTLCPQDLLLLIFCELLPSCRANSVRAHHHEHGV